MKLLGVHPSPFTRKVRIVLAEKKIEYDFVIASPQAEGSPDRAPAGQDTHQRRRNGAGTWRQALLHRQHLHARGHRRGRVPRLPGFPFFATPLGRKPPRTCSPPGPPPPAPLLP